MPKSRNRSRDIRKRAQKKRNEKARLERRHAEMINDRALTAQLWDETKLKEIELLSQTSGVQVEKLDE
jgi:hypothetical protein